MSRGLGRPGCCGFVSYECLLSRWLWKIDNEEGLWQELNRNKYLSNVRLSQCKLKPVHSHFWYGLIMEVKDMLFKFCRRKNGNEHRTRFWEDVWRVTISLAEKYPGLYNLCNNRNVEVSKLFADGD